MKDGESECMMVVIWFTDRCSTRGDHEAWFDMFHLLLHLDLVCNVNTRRGPEEFCVFSCSTKLEESLKIYLEIYKDFFLVDFCLDGSSFVQTLVRNPDRRHTSFRDFSMQ